MADYNRKRMTFEQQRALKQRNAQMSGSVPPDNSSAPRRESVRRSNRTAKRPSSRTSDAATRNTRNSASRSSARGTTRTQNRSRTRVNGGSEQRSSARKTSRPSNARGGATTQRQIPIGRIAIIAGIVIAAVLVLRLVSSALPITVNINGTDFQLRGEKTLQTAAKESGLPLNPGDLISLQGKVLTRNEGKQFTAVVNGEKVEDLNARLHDGDKVSLSDGEDIVEPYDVVEETIPRSARVLGVGALHVITSRGSDGIKEIRTGTLSGDVVEKQTVAPEEVTCQRYNPDVGGDKVIALTFDDGPSKDYTAQILDILAENDAKATFFVVGTNVELENNVELVQRAASEGHQVCTHTYDHARAGGSINVGSLPAEGQVEEVVKGRQTITDATGTEASTVIRLPGGNMDEQVLLNLYQYFDSEIGWNVDTGDWTEPGADEIEEVILMATAGDVVLMHDGGGDRSQTVEALRKALPQLIRQGYTFVTIDELLQYPSL